MNRDDPPAGPVIALATGEMMVTARRITAAAPHTSQVQAAAAVRAAIARLWPKVPPEAARDVLCAAAELACDHGITAIPKVVIGRYPGQLGCAIGMLELTAEWVQAGRPVGRPGSFTPPWAFASSCAFDRAEDEWTLTSVAVLLALSHLALAAWENAAGGAAGGERPT